MAYTVSIRENATGIIRRYTKPEAFDDHFLWDEGNYSCDCNRRLFFARAVGEDEPDENPCSDGAFSVQIHDVDTGKVLYDEFAGGADERASLPDRHSFTPETNL